MGHFKDSKWSLCTKSRLFEGPETFLDLLMARAIARAILGPKKSRRRFFMMRRFLSKSSLQAGRPVRNDGRRLRR
jgi:hypothetical protein